MTLSPQSVANEILKLAQVEGKKIANMQLQKLVFLSHCYVLAIIDRPLYFGETLAWQWGPVIPSLYKSLQKYGRNFVTDQLDAGDCVYEGNEAINIIRSIWKCYSNFTSGELSLLTTRDETPWRLTWSQNKFGIISNDLISDYYKKII